MDVFLCVHSRLDKNRIAKSYCRGEPVQKVTYSKWNHKQSKQTQRRIGKDHRTFCSHTYRCMLLSALITFEDQFYFLWHFQGDEIKVLPCCTSWNEKNKHLRYSQLQKDT